MATFTDCKDRSFCYLSYSDHSYDLISVKLLFATLLCHRDCEIFKFNWFASRLHLDHGFDIPHLVLNDGSLDSDDIASLRQLPNVFVDDKPVKVYDVPKAVYFAKLECFEVGFAPPYNADRVVVLDADVFFYRNWDADLRKICMSPAIALRDWGSSLGPHEDIYRRVYGVWEDSTTPNCNTGVFSIPKEQYSKLLISKKNYIDAKFMGMEDQGVFFGAFYGELEYINGIKCFVMGGESKPELLDWMLTQNGCHLMGMRARPDGLRLITDAVSKSLHDVNLKQITPVAKHVSWGLLEHDTYDFTKTFQSYPSSYQGRYITDALYMHGGSFVSYKLPPQFKRFTSKIVILDTGIPNDLPIRINSQIVKPGDTIDCEIRGHLHIETLDAPGSHLAFLTPTLKL